MKYDYIVVYSSRTGNTKRLATEIFSMLPGMDKDLKPVREYYEEKDTDVYFVGFWTDRGTCNLETKEFLSRLHGKKVAIFGTCGMGCDRDYYQEILASVKESLPIDNQLLGTFLCQGKMPITVRNRFEELRKSGEDPDMYSRLIRNFDQAMLHPNQEDYDHARLFVNAILQELHVSLELGTDI